MLYMTTKNSDDAYTAYRALTNNHAPDGGCFTPFHLPRFTKNEIAQFEGKSFNQTVAEILNLFFSLRLNGLDLDLVIGKNLVRPVAMNHRIIVAELWHNLGGTYASIEEALQKKLAIEAKAESVADWTKVAIKIAVIFGIYGQLLRDDLLEIGETVDFSVSNDAFVTPMALWYCRSMGLPVNTIICTCDENADIWDLIHRGTLSTSGITVPLRNGLEQLIHSTLGCAAVARFRAACENNRTFAITKEELPLLNKGLFCSVAGKNRAQSVMNSLYRTNSYIIDNCAALCYGGLQDYRAKTGESELTVILAEDTPLTCLNELSAATGLDTQTIKIHIN